jgi:uncharacterized protein (TIGR02996 family)
MAIDAKAKDFAGCPVVEYKGTILPEPAAGTMAASFFSALRDDPDDTASRRAFADYLTEQGALPPAVAYRVEGDGTTGRLEGLLADPAVGLVRALVIGYCWGEHGGDSSRLVAALVGARDRLLNLQALFLGDIPYHEREISWINHGEITGLFDAFPKLEHFRIRGGEGLWLTRFRHEHLRSLAFETSNLRRDVVRAVGASDLPALEYLEIWLGTSEYAADTEVGDLREILDGERLPALRHLGLRNSEIADDVAEAVAAAPVLGRLQSLDLSLGVLTDRGAEALLAAPALGKLELLDIHHHFVSDGVVERLRARVAKLDAGAAETDDGEEYRYVAHSE